jgi:hypothetical protein
LVHVGSVVGSNDKVSSSNDCDDSLHWKSGSDDKVSSEVNLVWIVETCCLGILSLINILDGPFLPDLVVFSLDDNMLTFLIITTLDGKDSVVLHIDEVVLCVVELLPPLTVCVPDLHVSSLSTSIDVK